MFYLKLVLKKINEELVFVDCRYSGQLNKTLSQVIFIAGHEDVKNFIC
jgi:hypothetical protein